MATSKSEIVSDVLRPNYGHCFHYVETDPRAPLTANIPTPRAARGTPFERVTCVVEDVSIRVNMFGAPDYTKTGRDLVNFLCADVVRAFQHPNIHTYVLAADMTCFGVEAKAPVQRGRYEKALATARRNNVRPYVWDIDNPEPIVDLNRKIPSIVALQAGSEGALRQALFEAMTLIPLVVEVPRGKRLILHMEPRHHTSPASIEDFLPDDPASGIVICDDRRDIVEAVRSELRALAARVSAAEWRREARARAMLLGRSGCFQTIPLVLETSVDGVTYAPFRLKRMPFQAGEADLAIQCYVPYLFTAMIVDRLHGERRPQSVAAFAQYYSASQLAASSHALTPAGPLDLYVGPGGRQQPQCTAVISTDSDFCMLLVYTIAVLISTSERATPGAPDPYDVTVPHAPLLVRGRVLTSSRATLRRGERRVYYPESAKSQSTTPLLSSHEIFDPGLLYADLVRGANSPERPLDVVLCDAEARARAAAASRQASRSGQTNEIDDDDVVGPVIHLRSPPLDASPDVVFEHVASVVAFTCMLGNDYLAGLQGAPRRWSYAAFADMLHCAPGERLVRVLRLPGENDVGPKDTRRASAALPLVVHTAVHERLIAYCYYMNLMAQACAANKPKVPFERLTIDDVARAVAQKYSAPGKQVPNAERRQRMAMRLLWVVRYVTHGTTNIRNIIDPLLFGWENEWLMIIV